MVAARPHSDPRNNRPTGGGGSNVANPKSPANPPGGRLNLLLSCAGWQADPWVNRLPRLLDPMGVHSIVAGSGRHASDVICNTQIHIAVVDLALPLDGPNDTQLQGDCEEGGPRLLELLSRLTQPPPTVVVKRTRTHRDDCRELSAALRAGAFAVIDRPRDANDLNIMLEVLRRVLTRFYQGKWPGFDNTGPGGVPKNVI
jgi:hypothetical protein